MKLLITILLFILVGVFGFSQKKQSKNSVTKNYSEEQALGYIDDYYNFYNADEFYDNPEARKISNNIFYIKVETCLGGKDICFKEIYNISTKMRKEVKNDFFWHSKVLILTINSNEKYTVKEKYNY